MLNYFSYFSARLLHKYSLFWIFISDFLNVIIFVLLNC